MLTLSELEDSMSGILWKNQTGIVQLELLISMLLPNNPLQLHQVRLPSSESSEGFFDMISKTRLPISLH